MPLLNARKVMEVGLEYVGVFIIFQKRMSEDLREEVFHRHYGSPSLVIAEMWFDIQQGEYPGASLTPKENSMQGFKAFMTAHFFLWVYPKNAGLTASRFHTCIRNCQGDPLWRWIRKIAALLPKKIKWDDSLGDPNKSLFIGSVDDIDMKMWEKRAHHDMNIDKSYFSEKVNHAGLKYEIIMHLTKPQCMGVVGPYKAGMHDMGVFRTVSKAKMLSMPGKMLIADSIFKAGQKPEHRDEVGMFAIPCSLDPEDLRRFKSRARARHESFNGRLKFFSFLQNCYRSTSLANHEAAFKEICVIVQYQMDHGAPIFDVN